MCQPSHVRKVVPVWDEETRCRNGRVRNTGGRARGMGGDGIGCHGRRAPTAPGDRPSRLLRRLRHQRRTRHRHGARLGRVCIVERAVVRPPGGGRDGLRQRRARRRTHPTRCNCSRTAAHAGAAWIATLGVIVALGGVHVLAVVLGVSYVVQVAPAIWTAWTTTSPTGVATATWTMTCIEGLLWGTYGVHHTDPATTCFAAIATLAASTMLIRKVSVGWRTAPTKLPPARVIAAPGPATPAGAADHGDARSGGAPCFACMPPPLLPRWDAEYGSYDRGVRRARECGRD